MTEPALQIVAAEAVRLLNTDQLVTLLKSYDHIQVLATAMELMQQNQLMELAVGVAASEIREKKIRLHVDTQQIEAGILDYTLSGQSDYLNLIADHMASNAAEYADPANPFSEAMKEPRFHSVGATITAAQMVADQIGDEKAAPILEQGQQLANLELGTKDRAEATKEFLDNLFAFLDDAL